MREHQPLTVGICVLRPLLVPAKGAGLDKATIRAGLVLVRARVHRVERDADNLDEALDALSPSEAEAEFRNLWRLAETGQQAGEMLLRQAQHEGFVAPPGIMRRWWRRIW